MSVIATTKLEVPPRRDGLVPRGALVAVIAGAEHTRLTMLSAPAGSGKTTLLQQWHLAAAPVQPFAWLSLEPSDNDPVRFWTCVIEALRTAAPGVGARAEGALPSPGVSLEDVVVPLLVNELSELPARVVLVLDDLHVVTDEHIHRSLVAFVERLPATVHLAVATRADPPWSLLPRLRARDQLVEIRSGQMRFSEDEAGSYLASLGLELPAEQIAQIQQRTEGWAAGLQLAGLSLREHPAGEHLGAALAGDNRQIGDYLAAEVLDSVAPEERRFLVRTSILERMSGPLCDAVIGGDGSSVRLAELDRRNLFVIALDSHRRWYRYHPLFADLLRARLAVEEPGTAAELHRRAAAWLAREGQIAEAVGHAIAARDERTTAELVAAHWLTFFNRGWLMTVRRWLDAMAPETLAADPELWLARAWTSMDLGELDEVGTWLEMAPAGDEWIEVLRALRLFKLGDVAGAGAATVAGVGSPDTAGPFLRTVAAIVTGVAAYWRGLYGEARQALAAADTIASDSGNVLARQYVLGYLALDAADHEGPQAARALLAEAAPGAGEPQAGEHFTAMMGHLALGRAAELEGHLGEAERELARAGELSRRGAGILEQAAAALAHARVLAALERRDAARARLARARELLSGCADAGILTRALRQAEHAPGLTAARPPAAVGEELSERELGVLRLLHSELSLRDIGAELFLSLNTIKTHTRNIYLKLGAGSRDEAVARARELGLL
ncbi:MAG TPA: LuxR C-terminal-related transcriptional regulator [Solirubrobacteraceae bacterium]